MSEKFNDSDVTLTGWLILDKDRMPILSSGSIPQFYNDEDWAKANLSIGVFKGGILVPAVLSWKQKNGPEEKT